MNNGPNNLHSGLDYYDARLWNAKEEAENAVTFTLLSPDGDQGYPGNAFVSVTYTLTDGGYADADIPCPFRCGHTGEPDKPWIFQPPRQ